MAIGSPFTWGRNGRKLTPEQVERERALVAAAQGRMGDTSPVGHWTQGATRVVDALGGVLRERRTDKAEEAGMAGADESRSCPCKPDRGPDWLHGATC
mgnify:CR=1 FL=1